MTPNLSPYPACKDSGVEWLGAVPAHWEVLPNRAVYSEVKERDHPEAEMLSVTITQGVIQQKALLSDSSKKDGSNQDKSAYKLVRPGDIVYNKMRAWQGAVGVSNYLGIVSPAYVVQRPRAGADAQYLHYLLRTPAFAKEAERWSYGITSDMWSLRPEHFKMIYGCLPPLPEQSAIVRFLDHTDRRIRRYIRARQKLIRLLQEQMQAIVHRAVTGQIDVRTGNPYPAYEDSGVEWLGAVPAHWEVLPIKRAFVSMVYGISESATNEGTIRLLTMGHIRDGNVTVPADGGVASVDPSLLVERNDLLFNRTNSAELVGKVGLFRGAPIAVTFASYLVRMRPRPGTDSEFLNLLLNDHSVLSTARREAIPSLHQANLNPTRYGRLHVALPGLIEQEAIFHFVTRATTGLRRVIDHAHRHIALLREYRTRLIADVVTGKLDVREAAARLPEEVEVDEPFYEVEAEADAEDADGELDAVPEEAEA